MKTAIDTFQANLDRVRSIHGLYVHFSSSVTAVVDLSDLLRAELVLIVSALDHFVHELTRLGMLEVWRGHRQPTVAYGRFSVSLDAATLFATASNVEAHLESEIRARHSIQSFQQPDKIADAVRCFSSVDLWNEVGNVLGEAPKDLKIQLRLIVERRNKIAHEADIDPSYPGQRWPINRKDTEDALAFVESICEAIYKLVA